MSATLWPRCCCAFPQKAESTGQEKCPPRAHALPPIQTTFRGLAILTFPAPRALRFSSQRWTVLPGWCRHPSPGRCPRWGYIRYGFTGWRDWNTCIPVRATYESERGDLWAETFCFSLTQCPASVRGRPGPGDWDWSKTRHGCELPQAPSWAGWRQENTRYLGIVE